MVTYSAKATAEASVVAQFFFRKEETVTATASATAESNVSEEDAYNIALQIAQDVANSAAQNDANVLIQSVNTSTLGDNTLFLSSSLLKDFVERVGDNEYNLVKDLNVPSLLKVIVIQKETFTISKGLTANMRFDNLGGTMYIHGKVICGPAPKSGSKDFSNQIISKASAGDTTTSSTNTGNLYIGGGSGTDYVSSLEISPGQTYTNESGAFIQINTAVPGYSGGTLTIDAGGTFTNQGSITNYNIFTNNGLITNNNGIFNNGSSSNSSATLNNSGIFHLYYIVTNLNNYGTIINGSSGSLILYEGATFTNTNTGNFTNQGFVSCESAYERESSTIQNNGTIYNGTYNNYSSAVINNVDYATFNNGNPSNSSAILNNYGTFNNQSTLSNLNNYGSFYFENKSQFNNYGTVNQNNNNAKFQGSSSNPTYSIYNYEFGVINLLNDSTLTVTTNGKIYTNYDDTIAVKGTGTINKYGSTLGNLKAPGGSGEIYLNQGSYLYTN